MSIYTKVGYSFVKKKLKTPVYLIFFITNRCNSRCKHCFYWRELGKKKDELSLDEIDKFSNQVGKLIWVSLSGGEPFLRKDIAEIYRIFVDNNKVEDFAIPTNGMLPSVIEKEVEKMLKHGKANLTINLSVDGTRKIHNDIRGIKCYDSVFETYKRLEKMKKKYPGLSIMVSTTMSGRNIDNLEELHEEVKKKMPAVNFHNFEILRGDPRDKKYGPPTIEQLEKIYPVLEKIWKYYNYYNSKLLARIALNTKKSLHNMYIWILKNKKQPIPCYAGRVHCVLDHQGEMYMCEMLPSIGNFRKSGYDFKKVWFSEKAKKMRKDIENKKCYCTHSCFQITNYIFNQKKWIKLLK
jgi:MoaA/NifB/PqqE/SkfB family radical SAM enzyme